jgi:hypothetical protein
MECLPGPTVLRDLSALGHRPEPTGEGERILAGAIVEKLVAGPDGSVLPWTTEAGSRAIAATWFTPGYAGF